MRLDVVEVPNIACLRSYYGFANKGKILETDLKEENNLTEKNERRYRDAEVLTTIAANVKNNILDIGTHYGRSAFKMATNIEDSQIVFTVNVLPEQLEDAKLVTDLLTKNEIGTYFRERDIRNIKQFYADTSCWDIPEEISNIDLAFVDGAHDTKNVYMDSKLAYDKLNYGGFIIWHDFSPPLKRKFKWIGASMKGVKQFLKERQIKTEILHLKHSFMGVMRKA